MRRTLQVMAHMQHVLGNNAWVATVRKSAVQPAAPGSDPAKSLKAFGSSVEGSEGGDTATAVDPALSNLLDTLPRVIDCADTSAALSKTSKSPESLRSRSPGSHNIDRSRSPGCIEAAGYGRFNNVFITPHEVTGLVQPDEDSQEFADSSGMLAAPRHVMAAGPDAFLMMRPIAETYEPEPSSTGGPSVWTLTPDGASQFKT